MAQRQNIIELNGRRYDALTGKQLPAQSTVKTDAGATYVRPAATHTGTAIDGMSKHAAARATRAPAKAVHQRSEHSKTLMRHAVKKPQVVKTSPSAQKAVKKPHNQQTVMDTHRLTRASKVPRSNLISRFGEHGPKPLQTATSVLPIQPAPVAPPLLDEHHHTPLDKKTSSATFHHAIQHATAHEQPPHKAPTKRQRVARKMRISPKVVSISAAGLSVLLLVGFFAYQNVPNVSMHVAMQRAGISGSLPSYHPAGFGMNGPIQYQKGQITINYKSTSDNRQFRINQKSTDWNGQALLDQFVANNKRQYQTYQKDGKTIYIYDESNATWVNDGVWYQIEGKSALNSDQLLRLAASM